MSLNCNLIQNFVNVNYYLKYVRFKTYLPSNYKINNINELKLP